MSRAGRKRKSGDRKPSGGIVNAQRPGALAPVIPPEALLRRAEGTGGLGPSDQRAGSALGRLYALGYISEAQHDAGQRLVALWQSWSCMAGAPRYPTDGRPVYACAETPDAVVLHRWRSLKADMAEVHARVLAKPAGGLAWSLITTVVADDLIPPRMDHRSPLYGTWDIGSQALADALDAVAQFFGVRL